VTNVFSPLMNYVFARPSQGNIVVVGNT